MIVIWRNTVVRSWSYVIKVNKILLSDGKAILLKVNRILLSDGDDISLKVNIELFWIKMIHFINIKKTFQQTKMMNLSLQMKANKNDSRHSAIRLITICLCVILSLCTEVHADNITPKEALQIAKRYVRVDKKTQRKILTRTSSASQSSFSHI